MSGGVADQRAGRRLLDADPWSRRLSESERDERVADALASGAGLADEVRSRWGAEPSALAHACGVPVCDDDGGADYGTVQVFAEYCTRPPRIVLYQRALARIDRWLAGPGVTAQVGIATSRPLFIAHELFHHLDLHGKAVPLARRHAVTLLSLGPWRWTAALPSLAEIGAGAFAQRLLGLRVHPDWIVRSATQASQADARLGETALPDGR